MSRKRVFHRIKRARSDSSERSAVLDGVAADNSVVNPVGGWWPVGLLINTYLNTHVLPSS
jgi:hypothetical protein